VTLSRTILAGVLLLFLAALAGVFYQTGNLREARAEAETLRNERIELTRSARESSLEAERVRGEAIEMVVAAEARQRQAERRADSLEARTARQTAEASASGQAVLQAVQELLAVTGSTSDLETLVLAHLEDDQLLALSNEAEKAALREALDASDARGDALEMRALASEHALDLSQVECQLCRVEANAFRRAANPGWFEKLRQRAPSTLLTVAGTVLLALLI